MSLQDGRRTAQATNIDERPHHGRLARFLVAAPLVAVLAFACLIFLSWTGWGFEADPVDQLLRDLPWVVAAAFAGAASGAVAAWAFVGWHSRVLAVGAAVGALPAGVMVTAYFTGAY